MAKIFWSCWAAVAGALPGQTNGPCWWAPHQSLGFMAGKALPVPQGLSTLPSLSGQPHRQWRHCPRKGVFNQPCSAAVLDGTSKAKDSFSSLAGFPCSTGVHFCCGILSGKPGAGGWHCSVLHSFPQHRWLRGGTGDGNQTSAKDPSLSRCPWGES